VGFRKLGALSLVDVHISLNIIRVMKLKIMAMAGIWHAWESREVLLALRFGNWKERGDWEDLDVNWVNIKISLKEIGWDDVYWIYEPVSMDQWRWTFFEYGYEPSGPIKCGERYEWLKNWQLFKDLAPSSYVMCALAHMFSVFGLSNQCFVHECHITCV
jgi:hypothetical protein